MRFKQRPAYHIDRHRYQLSLGLAAITIDHNYNIWHIDFRLTKAVKSRQIIYYVTAVVTANCSIAKTIEF